LYRPDTDVSATGDWQVIDSLAPSITEAFLCALE